jgi:putative ABC transport system permease protein
MNDLRFAVRLLGRSPGFTAVATLTIAVGIGACTAIFSVVDGVLLRPLAFPEPDRVMAIRETFLPRITDSSVASGKYLVWRDQARSFESLAAFEGAAHNLTGGPDRPVHVAALRMTANALPTFRVQPLLGRNFLPEEEAPGKNRVAIVAHGLWQRQFGGHPGVLGTSIQLDGRSHRVVGVMSRESPLPEEVEVVTPLGFDEGDRHNFGGHSLQVLGRLKQDATVEQARAELAVMQERIGQQHGRKGWGIKVNPLLESAVADVRPVLMSLLGAVGLLLLIACANVANLLLARATGRAREIAVRAAIGANRRRLVRQLLLESVLLGLLGGGLGVLIAQGGLSALLALAPENLPRLSQVAVDWRVLAFSCALALLTGMGFGLAPALQATQVDLNRTLREGGRGGGDGGQRGRLRSALVVGEVAIALMLLAGAGLLMRSFARLSSVSPGFRPEDALVVNLHLPGARSGMAADGGEQVAFASEALRRLATLPGVTGVGLTQRVPFAGGQGLAGMEVEGRKFPPGDKPITNHYTISADYLKAMGIPLLRGRAFDARDGAGGRRVALINEAVARKVFGGRDPLGKRINITNGPDAWREIVGVVGDIRNRRLDAGVTLQTYEPFAQQPGDRLSFIVRTAGPVLGLAEAVRSAIYAVDPQQPIARIRPLTDFVAESIARQRFAMSLFAVFSALALLLAAIGIYGVMAYSVRQRSGEIGIRMALGAQSSEVLVQVLAQGGRLIGLGVLVGLVGAFAFSRLLASLLYGVSAHDPLTMLSIALLLSAVAAVASLVPARRAAKLDPMTALR